jgi:hypothetical protein
MAETSIAVQPAGAPAAPAPAPLQLKMFTASDGTQANAASQGVCLVDEQGRAYSPLSEMTGRKIVRLLDTLCRLTAEQNGQLYSPDQSGPDAG